jgi:aromatic amino acid permease
VSQLRLRPRLEREGTLTLKMWAFPGLTWATLVALAAIVVLMLFDDTARQQLVATVGLFLLVAAVYVVREQVRRRRGAPLSD